MTTWLFLLLCTIVIFGTLYIATKKVPLIVPLVIAFLSIVLLGGILALGLA